MQRLHASRSRLLVQRRRSLRTLLSLLASPVLACRGAGRAGAATALAAPAPATLEYDVFLDDYRAGSRVATLTQRFERHDGRYRLHSEAHATGLLALVWRGALVQTSEGTLDAQGLSPTRYEERRGNRAPRGATIDRAAGVVRFLDGSRAPASPGLQDRLSALVQLGLLVAAGGGEGRPLPAGHVFAFALLRTSRIAPARWRVEGADELALDGATLAATRVRQVLAPHDDSPLIEAWFGEGRAPWPARVRIAEPDGRTLDQILKSAG